MISIVTSLDLSIHPHVISDRMLNYLKKQNDTESQKYDKILRKLTGYFGLSLPFICIGGGLLFGSDGLQNSISAYFYTNMREAFSGILFFVSLYLMVYQGYLKIDFVLSLAAGVCALIVAIVPCAGTYGGRVKTMFPLDDTYSKYIHLASASVFFAILALMALFLFTKSAHTPENRSSDKNRRKMLYRISGRVILTVLGLLGVSMAFELTWIDKHYALLIGETIMLAAFSISWLVKGKVNIRPWLVSAD